MIKSLPIIVQSIVYKKEEGNFKVLLMKRTEERGGFWNVVNGTLEINESVVQCRQRELNEEAGITSVKQWSEEVYRFSFPYKDYTIVVIVYLAEVSPDQKIILNEEHTEYKWSTFSEAINLMKFEDDKKALQAGKAALS